MSGEFQENGAQHGWSALGRDWGIYFKRVIQYQKAEQYFDRSLKCNPLDPRTLFESSQCKLKQSDASDALDDVKKCVNIEMNNTKAKFQYARCLAGLNEIENAFSMVHTIADEHPSNAHVQHIKNSLEIALRRAFGPSSTPILRRYKRHLEIQNQCSTPNANISKRPVLEHRQKAIEFMKHNLYFDGTFAEQMEFWTRLQQDETFDGHLRETIERLTLNLHRHENLLYTREPVYAKRDRFDGGSLAKARRRAFYFAQEETQREALWQLKNIKYLVNRNFDLALALTERVFTEYYAIKTRAVFPRKFELLCQLCMLIGGKYQHIYRTIPPNLMCLKIEARLIALFNVHGTFQHEDDLCDRKVDYFNERLRNADYDMERAYLYHQLSEVCFRFRRPEESQRFARDALTYANRCKSNIWAFLAYFNIIRVDAIKRNYHMIGHDLDEMRRIAEHLDSFTLVFVNTAIRSYDDIQAAKN